MRIPTELYRPSLAMLTDLYQLSMAYGYWKSGVAEREAVFHQFFRKNPFKGGYAIACGLAQVVDLVSDLHFDASDLSYLETLTGQDGKPLFDRAFLDHLGAMKITLDVDAVPEGTVVFPHQPLVRVQGPVIQCQLLETALLNMVNFQTLVATKASRICHAAKGEPVLEFGLRRAQGIDGALAASRAAYLGGCSATSNVLAGKLFGIPVKGTHAHAWVMLFDSEPEAFRRYAEAMPNNCVFLVDTYDTLQGVKNAIETGHWLRSRGHELLGIRLDSGDLAWLSIEARKLLDAAGFPKATIVASNDLDENIIVSLKDQGAAINVWGVGTKLVTAYDEPALGGVYKLTAVREGQGAWQYRVKISEQTIKVSTPGILNVRRYEDEKEFMADVVFDEELGIPADGVLIDPVDLTRQRPIPKGARESNLLAPVMRQGRVTGVLPTLAESRARAQQQLAKLHGGIKRFVHPHQYPVGLEGRLHQRRTDLILKARGVKS